MSEPTIASVTADVRAAEDARRLARKNAAIRQVVNLREALKKDLEGVRQQRAALKDRGQILKQALRTIDELENADLSIEAVTGLVDDLHRISNGETLTNTCCGFAGGGQVGAVMIDLTQPRVAGDPIRGSAPPFFERR